MPGLASILREAKTIAVVGLSANTTRDSYRVAKYLQGQGYRIIPVNPKLRGPVLGEKPYPDLGAVPGPIDLVDIFRRSIDVPPVVESAMAIGAPAVWMQLGIIHEQAARKARAAGLDVVMDRCTAIEHRRLKQKETDKNL